MRLYLEDTEAAAVATLLDHAADDNAGPTADLLRGVRDRILDDLCPSEPEEVTRWRTNLTTKPAS